MAISRPNAGPLRRDPRHGEKSFIRPESKSDASRSEVPGDPCRYSRFGHRIYFGIRREFTRVRRKIVQCIRGLFDSLHERTSDQTLAETPYGERQTTGGVYAIANTQPSDSTYGPSEATRERDATDASSDHMTSS
jgi:hypothetical protein